MEQNRSWQWLTLICFTSGQKLSQFHEPRSDSHFQSKTCDSPVFTRLMTLFSEDREDRGYVNLAVIQTEYTKHTSAHTAQIRERATLRRFLEA